MKSSNKLFTRRLGLLSFLAHSFSVLSAQPEIRWRAGGHFLGVESVDFLPDGQRLISASSDVDVKLWQRTTGRLVWTSAAGRFGSPGISLAPDGSFYVAPASELDTNLVVQSLTPGFPVRSLGSLRYPAARMAVSPSGRRAAAAGSLTQPGLNRDLRVWTVETGAEIAAWSEEHIPVFNQWLEFLSEDDLLIGSTGDLVRRTLNGAELWRRSVGASGSLIVKAVAPARDRILIEEDRALKMLDAATGQAVWTRSEELADSWRAKFSSDGKQFVLSFSANAAAEGRLEIRAADDGALLRSLPSLFSVRRRPSRRMAGSSHAVIPREFI